MEVVELALEIIREREEFFKNAEKYIKTIAERAKELLNAKTFVFGSYLKGNYDKYLSDIDLLIVTKKEISPLERAKYIVALKEGIKGSYIFQIHLINEKDFETYKFFIDKMKLIKV